MQDLVLAAPKEMVHHGVMVNVTGLMGSVHLRVRFMDFNSYINTSFALEFV